MIRRKSGRLDFAYATGRLFVCSRLVGLACIRWRTQHSKTRPLVRRCEKNFFLCSTSPLADSSAEPEPAFAPQRAAGRRSPPGGRGGPRRTIQTWRAFSSIASRLMRCGSSPRVGAQPEGKRPSGFPAGVGRLGANAVSLAFESRRAAQRSLWRCLGPTGHQEHLVRRQRCRFPARRVPPPRAAQAIGQERSTGLLSGSSTWQQVSTSSLDGVVVVGPSTLCYSGCCSPKQRCGLPASAVGDSSRRIGAADATIARRCTRRCR
jgi:hypothetical protein